MPFLPMTGKNFYPGTFSLVNFTDTHILEINQYILAGVKKENQVHL
jgi:hypothetical protein